MYCLLPAFLFCTRCCPSGDFFFSFFLFFFKVGNLAFTEESQQKKIGSTQPSWSPHSHESTAEFYRDIFPCCRSCLVFCCVFAVVFRFFVLPASIFMEMLELCNSGFVSSVQHPLSSSFSNTFLPLLHLLHRYAVQFEDLTVLVPTGLFGLFRLNSDMVCRVRYMCM